MPERVRHIPSGVRSFICHLLQPEEMSREIRGAWVATGTITFYGPVYLYEMHT